MNIKQALTSVAVAGALLAPVAAQQVDWASHDRTLAGDRFSPATQITPANIGSLQVAWTFDTAVTSLQVTPLVVNGVMYITSGKDVTALEPETGKVIWKFTAPATVSRRGVAYWPGAATTPPRLFMGAGETMLALDARTGQPAAGFGNAGYVDLKPGILGDVDGRISLVSQPIVYKNIVITGGNNGEQFPSFGLYGDIRGWDAISGKPLWSFHTVPRAGEPGVETWEGESWKNRSGVNMWAFFTVDAERGIVYAPLTSPTADYYGGDRKGDNLYGNSLVALDATTGKLKWHRQLVHHDLWDFDLPAAPTLIDVKRGGRTIPAVAVMTKMTFVFIFDRVTGEPIFGIEERPVPKSTVPGEASSPTQPYPVKPAPLGRITFDPAKDFYTLTPDHAAFCKELWTKNDLYTEGTFTPPSVDRFMVTFPSTIGGGNWNGFSYDPVQGLLFTNFMNLGQVGRMQPAKDPQTGGQTYRRNSPWGGPVGRFWNPETQVPCSAPPFGELVAVNVNTGDVAWRVPLGIVESLKAKGFAETGTLNIGGSIATAGGLVFVGATIDHRFRAFDSHNGKLLWEVELEASAHSIPMTFVGKDGRQYVVIAAGGGSYVNSRPGTKITAFALPGRDTNVSAPVAARQTPASGALPEGDGRAAVDNMCGAVCHGVGPSVARRHNKVEWQAIVDDMRDKGAPGSDADAKLVVAYLTRFFGRVNVNTESAEEIQRVLELSTDQAKAIVAWRSSHPAFTSVDDVTRVDGLDPAKLEAVKNRMVFAGR